MFQAARKWQAWFALSWMIYLSCGAWADNPSNEIVVTASRMTRNIQSEPHAVYRLEGDQSVIRDARRTTPDVLNGIPSVMVQKTSYGQGSPYLRGFTGFRTLCMVEGIRLNNSVFRDGPNQYWNTVDPLSVAGYELVMGPGSVLYGSDAVGGLMNATPVASPDWAGEPEWESRLHYRGASAERSHTGRVQIGGRVSEQLGFAGGYSRKNFGDLRGGDKVGVQEHTGYDEQDFDVRLDYEIGKNSLLALGHQSVRQNNAWRTHKTIYGIDWEGLAHGDGKVESYDQARDLTYLQFQADSLPGFVDGVRFILSRHAQGEHLYRVKKDDKQERQGFDVITWGSTLQLESDTSIGRWVYGFDYYHDIVDSFSRKYKADGALDKIEIQGPVADDATYDTAGVFLQDVVTFWNGKLDVIPGIRYTFAAADANKVKDPVSGNATSLDDHWQSAAGSLRLLVPLVPDRSHVLYAGAAQGFRSPNLSDLTRLDTARSNEMETPSPDLDPERYLSYEIGFKSRTPRWVSQISYYYTVIDGMIVRTPTGQVVEDYREVTKKNSGDGYIQGAEISETFHFAPQWSLWVSAAWMDGKVDTYPTSTSEKERDILSRLMPPMTEMGLRWENDRYWCELVGNLADKADKLSAEDERDTQRIPPGGTPGYAVCHVRAGTQLTRNLALSLAVENVFDEDYRIHGSGVNEPGRNIILTATCNL